MNRPTPLPAEARRGRGFTLTEILIALAIVALLLIGISRIFAITSSTIGAGQATAKALRSDRALQTALGADVQGIGDLANPDYQSGMLPLSNTADPHYAAPFLAISNYRVAAYKNKEAEAGDVTRPAPFTTLTAANYAARSDAIRSIDLNDDGDELDVGEVTPIYQYGERNFRADTLSFFSRGKFTSQTGTDAVIDPATSNEAWIWYGHLRVFNSDAASIGRANGYGAPGDALTPTFPSTTTLTAGENRNNLYADDFRLGRVATLLVEPTDIKADGTNLSDQQRYERNGVLLNRDFTKPIAFVRRDWWSPYATDANLSLLPILPNNNYVASGYTSPTGGLTSGEIAGQVYKFRAAAAVPGNYRIGQNDAIEGTTTPAPTTPYVVAASGRTDVAGAGITQLHRRVEYVSSIDANWWRKLPNEWTDRFWVNPFPAKLDASGFAQRQQILTDGCSQFIVEYAGDFISQDPASGARTLTTPDGTLDFVVVDGVRQTRWYGLPRDVDGNGAILNSTAGMLNSPDVIPLRDVRGAQSVFERRVPPAPTSSNDYLTNITEPAPATTTNSQPSGYVCVWGPNDAVPDANGFRSVPQLIRVITDVRDPSGRLKEAVTQEMILPVRVTASLQSSTTP